MTQSQTLHRYHQEKHRGFIGTNLLTKFHEDWTRNVPSRVFTRRTAPPTGNHVFQRTGTTFEFKQDIIKTNIFTNFELNRAIIGSNLLTKFHEDRQEMWPLDFELDRDLIGTKLLTKVFTNKCERTDGRTTDKDRKTAPTVFELVRDSDKTNVLTKFHDDWAKIVTSRVFTRKTATQTSGHVFQRTGTTFKCNQHIIKTSILTKLHEDWA
ncbi:hypothetical protein DPMN_057225 [Dreissena polymorpha]|uniref:Uncharacterized protein n=1 Tax=Dreissena polymorpha TaxID=45954 RepID=A0A9D4HS67_DREPO|nr:hypothetical protein DPMN_057225 [Dreissena polymorpha]